MLCSCHHSKNKEYGVKPESVNVELKRQDYVNDTVLCDQHGPLYTPVQGKGWSLSLARLLMVCVVL